jgi:hypothetical protein
MSSDKSSTLFSLDKYAFNARVIPALLVLLPIGISIASLFPEKFAGWDLIVWLGTSAGLAVFLEQLARDRGLHRQEELFKSWGGNPSTAMLRHRESLVNRTTLTRYHERLGRIVPIDMPTLEEEINDPQAADAVYESCGDFLRAKTRDKEKFQLLFEENVNYGFRRNLWGMKALALILNVLSVGIVLTQVHPNWLKPALIRPVVWIAILLDASFLIVWLVVINPAWVKTTAQAYAKQLLAAIDVMEPKNQ